MIHHHCFLIIGLDQGEGWPPELLGPVILPTLIAFATAFALLWLFPSVFLNDGGWDCCAKSSHLQKRDWHLKFYFCKIKIISCWSSDHPVNGTALPGGTSKLLDNCEISYLSLNWCLPDFSTINRIINPKTALFVHFQITQKAATFEESLFDPPNLDHSSDQSNKLVLQLAPPENQRLEATKWWFWTCYVLFIFGCFSG